MPFIGLKDSLPELFYLYKIRYIKHRIAFVFNIFLRGAVQKFLKIREILLRAIKTAIQMDSGRLNGFKQRQRLFYPDEIQILYKGDGKFFLEKRGKMIFGIAEIRRYIR